MKRKTISLQYTYGSWKDIDLLCMFNIFIYIDILCKCIHIYSVDVYAQFRCDTRYVHNFLIPKANMISTLFYPISRAYFEHCNIFVTLDILHVRFVGYFSSAHFSTWMEPGFLFNSDSISIKFRLFSNSNHSTRIERLDLASD